jgi:hypothetical protein
MSYISCSACTKTLLSFCVYEQRLYCVFAVYVLAMHVNRSDNAKNRSIYCITRACRCAKAESCLRSMCVCDVYELQRVRKDVAVVLCIWAKTVSCLRSVCDCDACKSIWKCEKSINLLHHICLYVRKSWIMPSQYMCIYCIWAAINNEIYLYKMLTMNLLQAMLVRRAEQSHQHQQSSNSALLMRWAHTQSKSEAMTTRSSARWSSHIHRMTATSLRTRCN